MAAGRQFSYKRGLTDQSNNIDSLGAALARLNNLVSLPEDGIAFDLFAIVEGNEETALELETQVKTMLGPKLTEVKVRLMLMQAEVTFGPAPGTTFCSNWGI